MSFKAETAQYENRESISLDLCSPKNDPSVYYKDTIY